MVVDDDVARAIAALAADREHGATDLARSALGILRRAAGGLDRDPAGDDFKTAAERIVRARPTMAAVKNALARALADGPFQTSDAARRDIDRAEACFQTGGDPLALRAGLEQDPHPLASPTRGGELVGPGRDTPFDQDGPLRRHDANLAMLRMQIDGTRLHGWLRLCALSALTLVER